MLWLIKMFKVETIFWCYINLQLMIKKTQKKMKNTMYRLGAKGVFL
jgi:hypothetical protein